MHRFWEGYTGPLIEALRPRRLVEIGAEFGWNTRGVLQYCRREGAHVDVIETEPLPSLLAELAPYTPAEYTLHAAKSTDVLAQLPSCDFVLLDGDHNWRTVITELTLFFSAARSAGAPPPVVVAHDCAWPYARRDMYYNPLEWQEVLRRPYAYRGVYPGEPELVDHGLNDRFANALVEGGPENGVLTAIEDFVAGQDNVALKVLPFFNGLGVILPDARRTAAVDALVDSFFSAERLLQTCEALELDGMKVRAELLEHRRLLTQRTEALTRARGMLTQRAERIAELEAMLAARPERESA